MNKNSLLNLAVVLCKLTKLLTALIFFALTIVFLHFQFDRSSYEGWQLEKPTEASVQFVKTYGTSDLAVDNDKFPVQDWSTISIIFNYLKFGGSLIFVFLSINEFQKIMESVRSLKTFQDQNVKSFRKIGLFTICIFFLNIFSYWDLGTYQKQSFHLEFTPLIIAMFSYILAEIFKEGNKLKEENELTV